MTVVVCTHNRVPLLRKCLKSISQQINLTELDVVVVDNASTDNTAGLVEEWCDQIPGLRYVYEPKPGIAYARNRGLQESRHKHIAYLDDDVIAHPDWASNLYNAMIETNADEAGGRTTLYWEKYKPFWIIPEILPMLGESDLGDNIQIDIRGYIPNGANMAFLTASAEKAGGFPTELGVCYINGKDTTVLLGEETAIGQHLLERGGRIIYVGNAHVEHFVGRQRASLSAIYRRATHIGSTGPMMRDDLNINEFSDACVWAGMAALSSLFRFSWHNAMAFSLHSVISYANMKTIAQKKGIKKSNVFLLLSSGFKIKRNLLGIVKRTVLGPSMAPPPFGNQKQV
ncbi:MAG: glycosyltransferase family 2 protein [Armatimonadota bacterium]